MDLQIKKDPRSVTKGHDDNIKHREIDDCLKMTSRGKMLLERRLKNRQ